MSCTVCQLGEWKWRNVSTRHVSVVFLYQKANSAKLQFDTNTTSGGVTQIMRHTVGFSLWHQNNVRTERKKIVFNFKPGIIKDTILTDKANREFPKLIDYWFNYKLDPIPELTIQFVAKMSTIELLANLAGLCGMWLGFSVLQATCLMNHLACNCWAMLQHWKETYRLQHETHIQPIIQVNYKPNQRHHHFIHNQLFFRKVNH